MVNIQKIFKKKDRHYVKKKKKKNWRICVWSTVYFARGEGDSVKHPGMQKKRLEGHRQWALVSLKG